MKRIEVVYRDEYRPTPVSYWVHRDVGDTAWTQATEFDPPLPSPVPGQGFAELRVECDGVELRFASRNELDHVIEVLAKNPLPTTRRLSEDHGSGAGPNRHWLSRLPGRAKSAKFRAKLVRLLVEAREEFGELF